VPRRTRRVSRSGGAPAVTRPARGRLLPPFCQSVSTGCRIPPWTPPKVPGSELEA
jgi:hypothetical protein